MERTRAFAIYVNGKKWGTLKTASLAMKGGDELQIGLDGVIAISEGQNTTDIEGDSIETVAGQKITLLDMFINKRDVSLGVPFGGKIVKVIGRLNGVTATMDAAKGTTDGKYTFIAGRPELTG